MSKTIEEQLATLQELNFRISLQENEQVYPSVHYEHWVDSALMYTTAIAEGWNAAVKAMERVVPLITLVNDCAADAYRYYDRDDPLGAFLEDALACIANAQIDDALVEMKGEIE